MMGNRWTFPRASVYSFQIRTSYNLMSITSDVYLKGSMIKLTYIQNRKEFYLLSFRGYTRTFRHRLTNLFTQHAIRILLREL